MINHARTLLLNISGSTAAGYPYPGEEVVPQEFVALSLPQSLVVVRNLLLGTDPDRAMLNYRLRQLLTLVHASELGDYLTKLDSRITYWPSTKRDLFDAGTFGTTISQLAGSTTWALSPVRTTQSDTSTNRLLDQWKVEVTSATSATLTHLLPGNEIVTTTYINSGIAQQLTLPGSSLNIMIGQGVLGSGNWPTWQVQHLSKPQFSLSDIYVLLKQAESQLDVLFTGNSEPYATCRQLWNMTAGPIAYKLGAIVVALSYRLNEVFNKGN